jgi:hypothetical protein
MTRLPRLALTVALAALATTAGLRTVHAGTAAPGLSPAPAVATAAAPAAVEHSWYGWQILALDAALVGGAAASENPAPIFAMALSGPFIHLHHGHSQRALASLGLRVGAPIAGAAIGAGSCDDSDGEGWECIGAAAGGFLVGAAVAEGIDLIMATDEHTVSAPVVPTVGFDGRGATVGLAGSF